MTVNREPVDRFTLAHLAFGAAMGLARVPWYAALPVAVGWELVENHLKDAFPQAFPNPSHDLPANAVTDALAVVAGWALTRGLRRR